MAVPACSYPIDELCIKYGLLKGHVHVKEHSFIEVALYYYYSVGERDKHMTHFRQSLGYLYHEKAMVVKKVYEAAE